jgi:hypothetical protein
VTTSTQGDAGSYTIYLIGTLNTAYTSVNTYSWDLTITYTLTPIDTSAVTVDYYIIPDNIPVTMTINGVFTYTSGSSYTFTYAFNSLNACLSGNTATLDLTISGTCTAGSTYTFSL